MRCFELGGLAGLRTALFAEHASKSGVGAVEPVGEVQFLGRCEPDERVADWIERVVPTWRAERRDPRVRCAFALAGLDKLWKDGKDRGPRPSAIDPATPEDAPALATLFGCEAARSCFLGDGEAHVWAAQAADPVAGARLNFSLGEGVGFGVTDALGAPMSTTTLAAALGKNDDSVLDNAEQRAVDGSIPPWCLVCSKTDRRPTYLALSGRAYPPYAAELAARTAGRDLPNKDEPAGFAMAAAAFRATWAAFLCETWAPAAARAGLPRPSTVTFSGGVTERFPHLLDGLADERGGAVRAAVLADDGRIGVAPRHAGLRGAAIAACARVPRSSSSVQDMAHGFKVGADTFPSSPAALAAHAAAEPPSLANNGSFQVRDLAVIDAGDRMCFMINALGSAGAGADARLADGDSHLAAAYDARAAKEPSFAALLDSHPAVLRHLGRLPHARPYGEDAAVMKREYDLMGYAVPTSERVARAHEAWFRLARMRAEHFGFADQLTTRIAAASVASSSAGAGAGAGVGGSEPVEKTAEKSASSATHCFKCGRLARLGGGAGAGSVAVQANVGTPRDTANPTRRPAEADCATAAAADGTGKLSLHLATVDEAVRAFPSQSVSAALANFLATRTGARDLPTAQFNAYVETKMAAQAGSTDRERAAAFLAAEAAKLDGNVDAAHAGFAPAQVAALSAALALPELVREAVKADGSNRWACVTFRSSASLARAAAAIAAGDATIATGDDKARVEVGSLHKIDVSPVVRLVARDLMLFLLTIGYELPFHGKMAVVTRTALRMADGSLFVPSASA